MFANMPVVTHFALQLHANMAQWLLRLRLHCPCKQQMTSHMLPQTGYTQPFDVT
jgi:hypothetical protein